MGLDAGDAIGERSGTDLSDLRAEIDRIDRALHGLMIDRARVLDALVAAKGADGNAIVIRPDREEAILARLAGAHEGALPFPVVAHVWRTLIASFCRLQRPFRVHLADESPLMRDLARFHVGFDVPVVAVDGPAAALERLVAAPGDLALLPLGEAARPWWEDLARAEGPHVLARIPAEAVGGTGPGALVVGGALTGTAPAAPTLWSLSAAAPPGGAGVVPLASAGRSAYLVEAPAETTAAALAARAGVAPDAVAFRGTASRIPLAPAEPA